MALHYDKLKILLMRRTFPELEENHVRPLLAELNGFVKYTDSKKLFTFPNGSIIKLAYCDSENDIYQFQGQEWPIIFIDEATQMTPAMLDFIATCNRSTRTDINSRIYYTCNPGGPGHDYIKRLFIDRNFNEYENPDDYVFIKATLDDNEVLMKTNPAYAHFLEALPDALRRQHRFGDWDVVEGQFYPEFRRDLHVCAPFDIPVDWRRFRAMDWGYNDPTCVLWFAVAPDKRLFVYREIYQARTMANDMASLIKRMNGTDKIAYTVASPDMWQHRGIRDVMGGESIADIFLHNGVPLLKADNARVVGWQRLREYFAIADDDRPSIQIFDNCRNLIRTLPVLDYDKHTREDVSSTCEDHAAEALRYGVMSRPSPARLKHTNEYDRIRSYNPLDTTTPTQRDAVGFFNLRL